MRFSLAVLALAASSASASIIARQLPSCANDCLFGPNVDLDGCSGTDNVCLCKSQTFVSKSTACIQTACSGDDLATALSIAQQLCLSVGVTLTSSSPAATDAASTAAESSADAPTTPAASSTSSSSKPTSTVPSSSTPTSAAASNTSATAPPATTSNAALANSANAIAGLAAIGLAALAL